MIDIPRPRRMSPRRTSLRRTSLRVLSLLASLAPCPLSPRPLSRLASLALPALLAALAPAVRAQSNLPPALDPFWRSQPVIGIWLSGGQGLVEVPAYLDDTDFPYARRPHEQEVPFADRLTVVRLLGGWIPSDLGKGETRAYQSIAQADLVTRRHGSPTRRSTALIDLGPLTCDAGACEGALVWDVPAGQHLRIASEGHDITCASADGSQVIGGFEIGTERVFDVHDVGQCPANGTDAPIGTQIGTMIVDPSELEFHFELMKARLDPYLAQGYTDLTLVLDNFPWALPVDPTTGSIGQTAPPASLAEWTAFVDRLAGALITYYGQEVAEGFRFRLGTEQQNEKRFSGTPAQYLALYTATVDTLRARLPGARIGPFNQAGADDDPQALTYGYLYENLPDPDYIDYVAHSLYYIPKARREEVANTYVTQRLTAFRRLWETLPMAPGTSIEFQEFGVLRNVYGVSTSEPGARGAAMHVADVFALLAAGVGGAWHWTAFERLPVARHGIDSQILLGRGWLYLVLEQFLGGRVHDVTPVPLTDADPLFTAHYIDTEGTDALVISAFNRDQALDSTAPHRMTVAVPKELMPDPGTAGFDHVALSQGTAVHDIIRADLAREGLLSDDFAGLAGDPVGYVKAMGGQEGLGHVARNWDRYRASIVDTLTRKPYAPTLTANAEAYRFDLSLPAPSVLVILVTPGP